MPRKFELVGPSAQAEGDPEIDGLSDFTVVSLQREDSRIVATVSEPASPGEQVEVEDAIFHLGRLCFSEIME